MNGLSDQTALLQMGITTTAANWELDEKKPIGFCRVYYVKNRAVRYTDEYADEFFEPETLYILPTAVPYRARLALKEPLHCTFWHLDLFPAQLTRLVRLPVERDSALYFCLRAMEKLMEAADREQLIPMLGIFPVLLSRTPWFDRPSPFMQELTKYITDHLNEDIQIETLSRITKYHPNYFISLFKAESGFTPHRYILRLRMQKARRLLITGRRVSEVALEVGYQDAASFTRAFKAVNGVTPQQYALGDAVILR